MEELDLEFWRKSIAAWPAKPPVRRAALAYAERLHSNNFPIIFEFPHLAERLKIRADVLADIVNRQASFYRTFKIPKRRGGWREIEAPSPILKQCQGWILKEILHQITPHSSAHAYVEGRDIIDNAKLHLNGAYLLKMDIVDFFPSITLPRIYCVFRNCGYAPNVSYFLAKICTSSGKLPQGAPTSPSLSNIIAKRLDKRLFGLCQKEGLTYSRYADDLTISGQESFTKLIKFVSAIIADEGFVVNTKKTVFAGPMQKKIVTGISISNGVLRVPRQYKRDLRQTLHFIKKFGVLEHQERISELDPMYIDSVLGKVTHWLRVEPDCEQAKTAHGWLTKYSQSLDLNDV